MRGSHRPRVIVALALGVLLLSGGSLYYLSLLSTGTLHIQVKDAPSTWLHLNITFDRIEIHRAGADNGSGWLSVSLTTRSIDFITLGNRTQVLAVDKLAAGTYSQLRIVVGQALGMTAAGARVTMVVPDQGILKTETSFTLPGGGSATMTLDFDLARSVHDVQGEWFFQPVLGSVLVG